MQPVIGGYSDEQINFQWMAASYTGLPVQYSIFISVFNPAQDITVPPLVPLATKVNATSFNYVGFTKDRYYQFAVAAVNDYGKFFFFRETYYYYYFIGAA